jgi:hypothetical protein
MQPMCHPWCNRRRGPCCLHREQGHIPCTISPSLSALSMFAEEGCATG